LSTLQIFSEKFSSNLIPNPMEYTTILPPGYDKSQGKYPLLYLLHGGGGNGHDIANRMQPIFENLWSKGYLPELIVIAPSVKERGFYMDFRDGSEKWETLLVGPLLEHLRARFKARNDKDGLLVSGISMGGMGSLRMAFKYPDIFGVVASLEPGIEPALAFKDIKIEDRFWRSQELFESIFGKPIDEAYWQANNPANIASRNVKKILASKLAIYLECGDEDTFGLDRGTEFLHRILRDNDILHEYHLVRWGDHIGPTVLLRFQEAMGFINRFYNPPAPFPLLQELKRRNAEAVWLAKQVQGR